MLNGSDLSNNNDATVMTRAMKGDFIIFKATQGTGFQDGTYHPRITQARNAVKLTGAYDYAVVKNDPVVEADYFLNYANLRPDEMSCLDFEPYKQNGNVALYPQWIIDWGMHVTAVTGRRPPLYLNGDWGGQVMRAATVAQQDKMRSIFDLWKATYGASSPGETWGFNLVLWQFSDTTGIDLDTYYGDAASWRNSTVSPTKESDMPLTDDDINKIATKVWDGYSITRDGGIGPATASGWLTHTAYQSTWGAAAVTALAEALKSVGNDASEARRMLGVVLGAFGPGTPDEIHLYAALNKIAVIDVKVDAQNNALAAMANHPDITPEMLTKVINDAIAAKVKVTGTLSVEPVSPVPPVVV